MSTFQAGWVILVYAPLTFFAWTVTLLGVIKFHNEYLVPRKFSPPVRAVMTGLMGLLFFGGGWLILVILWLARIVRDITETPPVEASR